MLLRELLRDVVYRDIVSRHSLRSARPLMTLDALEEEGLRIRVIPAWKWLD